MCSDLTTDQIVVFTILLIFFCACLFFIYWFLIRQEPERPSSYDHTDNWG